MLPENWTLDNLLQKHASKPYNPHIANVFYLAGFIESWGRGIEKINSACDKNGVPRAEYFINPGDIMVRFSAPKELVVRGTDKVNERVNDRMNHLTDKEKQTIRLLSEDPGYTVSQLSEKMNTSRKSIAGYLEI